MVAEEVDAVGADHAHLAACGFQHALYHVGGGGLALGAGHADHGHLAGGVHVGKQLQRISFHGH